MRLRSWCATCATLLLLDEEMSRTRAGRQSRPTSEELREVQRNLAEMIERPYGVRTFTTYPKWDGRAARVVMGWPDDSDVRREVLRLWTHYTRRFL